jgi:hypothetical protein
MKARYKYQQQVIVTPPGCGRQIVTVQHDYEGAAPMGIARRASVYGAQSGRLTARQERQIRKAQKRALASR